MKPIKALIPIIGIVVLGVGYFIYTNNSIDKQDAITDNQPINTEASSTLKTYKSENLGVEFQYSDPLVVSEKNGTIFAGEQRYNPKYAEGGSGLFIKPFSGDIEAFIQEYNKEDLPYEKITGREKIFDNGQITKEHLTASTGLGIDIDFIFVTRKNGNYVIDYNRINPEHLEVVNTIKDIE
jgi:hypothetical protein